MADNYKTYRTKGGFEFDLPEGVNPLDADVKAWVQAQERTAREKTPEFQAKVEAQRAEDAKRYAPESKSPVLENLGAGIDSAVQGFKQLMPGMKGMTDEQLQEKRTIDKGLAEKTQLGIGADWMPTAGSALQFAGEMLPAAALPAGAATGAAAKVLPRALQALVKTPLRAGVTSGAAAGAMQPVTSDESRTMNTALGAAGGAALPLAAKAYRFGREFTRGGAREAAAKTLNPEGVLPAHPAAESIRHAEDIPLPTSAVYNDPHLAMLERGSRTRNPAAWEPVDAATNKGVWENVQRGTARAGDVDELRAARGAGWQEREAAAMGNLKPRNWQREMDDFTAKLEQAATSPAGQNELRPVIAEIQRQIADLGPNFSPQHLARLRSRMASGVRGSPNDPFASAPKSDPYLLSLRDKMDDILNKSTGGKWERVLKGYAEESIPVQQAKAEAAVRGHFVTPEGTFKRPAKGDVPDVTEAQLRSAVTKLEGANKFPDRSPTFSPESGSRLKATIQALEQRNLVKRVKDAGTGGGGSNTAMDALAVVNSLGGMDGGGMLSALHAARRWAHGKALKEIDEALTNPEAYHALLLEQARRGGPPSQAQKLIARAGATGAGAGLPRALQAQEGEQ